MSKFNVALPDRIVHDTIYAQGWNDYREYALLAVEECAGPELLAANLATVTGLDEAFGINAIHDDEYIYDTLPSSGVARAYFMARAAIAKATGDSYEQP